MAATVPGIHLSGTHAARPAATAPPWGSLYACSDHGLLYYTDGATWTTWHTPASGITFGGTGDMPASNPGDAEAAGSSGKVSDAGHVHGREAFGGTGDMTAEAMGSTVSAGASGKVSDAAHRHAMPAFATPAIVLGTAAAAGVATTPIRSDGTIAAFDATAPVTQAYGDAAAAGSAAVAARRDHVHGMPASGAASFATPAIVLGVAAAAGAAATVIRSDGTIAAFDATAPTASVPGDASVVGVAAFAARRDHVHPRLTERVVYEFVIDGGGSAITTGIKGDLFVPDAFTLTGWAILLDQSGSIVIDVWNDSYANYPPTNADSLNAGGGTKPTVTTATKNTDTTLTGYDTSIAAGTLRFNVDSITTATRATIALFGYR